MLRGKDCKPGDKVRFLTEKGEGIVVRNTHEYVYVDIGDGFEIPLLHNEVIIMEQAAQKNTPLEKSETIVPEHEKSKPGSGGDVKESKREISGKAGHPERGMYLAFSPINQQVLLAGDLRIYLINYTKLKAFYSLVTLDYDNPDAQYSGHIDAASALLIATIERKDTSRFRKAMFQCLFPQSSKNGVYLPVHSMIEIKPERFMKEEMYIDNVAISMYSLTVMLFRMEELKLTQIAMGKESLSDGSKMHKAGFLEKHSLISGFQTAPGVAEVDLHIEAFVNQPDRIDESMKLKKQLDLFRECLESAIEENFSKIIFIHGVGVGVLKMEISRILRSYENLEFRDAPISSYGIGATEVIIIK